MKSGCCTAIVTPFAENGIDHAGLERLVEFQIQNGITAILAAGTTGESPTLNWQEHHTVIQAIALQTRGKCGCIAGTGSNNTSEALTATEFAAKSGVQAVLLVDPYYNGPSSLEIRREYIAPVARRFPELSIIPYVIPGRTGAQLLPEDLAFLFAEFKNVHTVKEATGSLDNMKRTRQCCGPEYTILSGDDPLTYEMMTSPQIRATGVISVVSNVAPKAVTEMVRLLTQGQTEAAKKLKTALDPLFNLVTVKTLEKTPYGEVVCKARNPLAIKTLMTILGMPAGGCRPPLGKMTRRGLDNVLETARQVQQNHPDIFQPIEAFFKVDVSQRLESPASWQDLAYTAY
jgi:4-hydroxy-tetrahydrodipicolinate synthase